MSLPGYTWQCGMKYTDIKFQTVRDRDLIFLLEYNIEVGISSDMGDRYVEPDENQKKLCVDANNLFGWAMSEDLLYDEIKFDKNVKLEEILKKPDDSDIGYSIEVDLKINPDDFSEYMSKNNPDTYTQTNKMLCDSTDKKNFLIHYRMFKFYFRHGNEVVKVHIVFSYKKIKWLGKYIRFNTQKRNKANNEVEKNFYKFLNNSFYGEKMENVRNRITVEITRKNDTDKTKKQQLKLTSKGIRKSHEIYVSYTFKQNEVLMDNPIYLGFSVLELSKVLMYETCYGKLHLNF